MRIFKNVIVVSLITLFNSFIYAQGVKKVDTIYYLIDTAHIPVKDRMISRDTEATYHFYQINCSCADSRNNIRFLIDEKTTVFLTNRDLLQYHFISLPDLLGFIKKNSYQKFRSDFVLYFIEPDKKKFKKTEMHLVDDYKINVVN